jgi:hypothetical protein
MRSLFLTTLLIIVCLSINTVGNDEIILNEMVLNGGFEQDTDGNGMADNWYFAGDAGVIATWDLDEGFVGRFSQKITCTQFTHLSSASHVMLAQENTVHLEEGLWYKISFAAKQKGILSQVAKVAIATKTWQNTGLGESFQVTNQWKQFEFVFQAKQTVLENTRLQFGYTSTGTFWLDDVQLEPSEPVVHRYTEIIPPTTSVNLLPNSSFECGLSGWGSIADLPYGMGNLNLTVGEVDTTTARMHQSSFKIAITKETIPAFHFDGWLYRVPVRAPLLANRGWITVEPGEDYTLSAYMKADIRGWHGVLSVQEAFLGSREQRVHLFTEWTRHTFKFRPQAEQIFIALGLDLDTPSQMSSDEESGTVWIDGVQLVKNNSPLAYKPRAAIEVGLETAHLGNLFPYGVEPEIVTTIFNSDQATHSIVLYVTTTDFDDTVVHETTLSVDVPPRQTTKISIDPGVRSKGFYRLHLRCDEADVVMTRPLRFAIIEPYTKTDSLFGINHAPPWSHLLELSKQIGILWFRDWSLQWQYVEPVKGAFDFTQPDYQINRLLERELNVLSLLPFPSSNWSSSAGPVVNDPGYVGSMAYMPHDLDEFTTYVRETVQNYHGYLGAWEILNEPIYSSYALPSNKGYQVSDYVQLLQEAYQTVKTVDPGALVIGGVGGSTHAEEFIEAGGLPWVDILNLHLFPGLTAPDTYEEPLRWLRERMVSVGLDIPIWLTEGAYYADDDKPYEPWKSAWLKAEPWSTAWLEPLGSEINASEWQVKLNTLLLAYGIEKIFYHSGASSSLNNEWLQGIFFEWAAEPRKMLVTQSAMANLLSPPIKSLGLIENPQELKAYGFESDGRTVIVAWVKEGAGRREISLAGKPWQAIDLQGNELRVDTISLTERPVYFVAEGTMPEEFPW